MSEPTVVVVESEDDGGAAGGAEFAAGVAAATSVQAAEEAGEAVEAAEAAQGTAEFAADVALSADANAWDAKAGVAELRDEMLGLFEEIRSGMVTATAAAVVEEVEEAAPEHPAPEPQDTTPKSHGDEKKAKGYGARGWFG